MPVNDNPVGNDTSMKKTSLSKSQILVVLLVILNIVFYLFYLSVPLEHPELNNLAIHEDTLIRDIIFSDIKNGSYEGPLLVSLSTGGTFKPGNDIIDWKINNPLYYSLPHGKARISFPLFKVQTRNPNLFFSTEFSLDTTYPGSGNFGPGGVDNFEERIFKINTKFYYFKGCQLFDVFGNRPGEGIKSIYSNSLDFFSDGDRIILKDKWGVKRLFESHSEHFRLHSIIDAFNNQINIGYTHQSQIANIESNTGSQVSFERNRDGKIEKVHSLNNTYDFKYNQKGALMKVIEPNGRIWIINHENSSYPNSITQIKNSESFWKFDYNQKGRIHKIETSKGPIFFNYKAGSTNFTINGIKYQFQDLGKGLFTLSVPHGKVSFQLNSFNSTKHYLNTTLNLERKFDDRSNLIWEKWDDNIFEYSYDPDSNLRFKTTKNGTTISRKIIEKGLIKQEEKEGIGLIQYEYDDKGNPLEIDIDNLGLFNFKRNSDGLITKVSHENGKENYFKWDQHRLIEWSSNLGDKIKLRYDGTGQLQEIIHPDGSSMFNQKAFSKPCSTLSPYFIDSSIKFEQRSNSLFSISDQKGHFDIQLGAMRRIEKASFPGYTRTYHYGEGNRLEKVGLENGEYVQVSLNSDGLLNSYMSSTGEFCKIEYDPKTSNVISTSTEKDFRVYEYDNYQRLQEHSINTVLRYKYKYGPEDSGDIYSITYPDGSKCAYTYDKKGRVSSIQFENLKPIQFNYSDDYNVELQFPNGISQYEEYDDDKHLTSISVNTLEGQTVRECAFYFQNGSLRTGSDDGRRISIEYDSNSNIQNYSIQGLVDLGYSYNDNNSLIKVTTKKNSLSFITNPKEQYRAIIDSKQQLQMNNIPIIGNIKGQKLDFLEVNGAGHILEDTDNFHYPNLEIKPGENTVLVKAMLKGGSPLETKFNFNVHPEASRILNFDASQRLQSIDESGSRQYYKFNAFNQLKFFKDTKGKVVEYRYLPNGKLASKNIKNRTIIYVYDPFGNLIQEISSTGKSLRKYVYDYTTMRPIIVVDGKNRFFCHTDPYGSILNLSNQKGGIVGEFVYSPFGQVLYRKAQRDVPPIGFLGMAKDEDTKAYLMDSGFYLPEQYLMISNVFGKNRENKEDLLPTMNYFIRPLNRNYRYGISLLQPPPIPNQLSYNVEFFWCDVLPNIHQDIIRLQKYLTQSPAKSK